MSQYRTGTATVTNGSATVTGSGTLWLANVSANDLFVVGGVSYFVSGVSTNTSLTLTAPYAGTTGGGKSYVIHRDFATILGVSVPLMQDGDLETVAVYNRMVQAMYTAYGSTPNGTAATADVTTSATDTTAGRLLKVGDFGVGSKSYFLKNIKKEVGGNEWTLLGQQVTTYDDPTIITVYSRRSDGGTANAQTMVVSLWKSTVTSGQCYRMDNHDGAVKLYLKGDLVYLRLSLDYIRVSVHVTSARDITGFVPDFSTALSADPTGATLVTPVIGYHTDNILGTVSQSGGVPTGAVIEAGSNANGNYTKYADGTMICSYLDLGRVVSLAAGAYTSTIAQALPAGYINNFTSHTAISAVSGYVEGSTTTGILSIETVSQAFSGRYNRDQFFGKVRAKNNSGVTLDRLDIHLIAIGRWF